MRVNKKSLTFAIPNGNSGKKREQRKAAFRLKRERNKQKKLRLKSLKKNKKNFLQKSKKILTFAVPKQTGNTADGARLKAYKN